MRLSDKIQENNSFNFIEKLNESSDSTIRVFDKGSEEYNKLEDVCRRLNDESKLVRYEVEDTYFDYGQRWMWTTLIARNPTEEGSVTGAWQALNPRQQGMIFAGKEDEVIQELLDYNKRIEDRNARHKAQQAETNNMEESENPSFTIGEVYKNDNGVELKIIDVDNNKGEVTYKLGDGETTRTQFDSAINKINDEKYKKVSN